MARMARINAQRFLLSPGGDGVRGCRAANIAPSPRPSPPSTAERESLVAARPRCVLVDELLAGGPVMRGVAALSLIVFLLPASVRADDQAATKSLLDKAIQAAG